MKLSFILLALLAAGFCASPAAPNLASTNRVLLIDPSSMPITAGTVTLTIGPLHRSNGVYSGDYQINVAPYFFKNEKGKLAIIVSDKSLARINQGKAVAIIGTATTSGETGLARHIDAIATPADLNHGKIKLWFLAGDRKMIFEPSYHLADLKH